MRIGDGIFGLMIITLGCAVIWYAGSFPNAAGSYYGPALFPRIIGTGLVVSGLFLVVRAVRFRISGFSIGMVPPFDDPRALPGAAFVVASVLAFALLGDTVGYQIITFLTLLVAFLGLRGGVVFCTGMALGLTIAFDVMFRILLNVSIPSGPLTGVLPA